jgi:hypothetical protein
MSHEDFDTLKEAFDETAEEVSEQQLQRLARHAIVVADGKHRFWFGWLVVAGAAALALLIGVNLVGQDVTQPLDGPITANLEEREFNDELEDLNDEELEELVVYLDMGLGDDFDDVDVLHGMLDDDFDPQWIDD